MTKRDTWRQPTPLMQLTAIRAGLYGTLHNATEGINVEGGLQRALAACEEIGELEPFIARNPNSWDG